MAQSVERRIGSAEVTGPIPVSSFSSFIRTGEFRIVAAVAQSVERRIGSAEVTGPIPVSSFSSFIRTGEFRIVAAVAQSVERRIGSAEVTGPIPVSSLGKSGSFWSAKGFCFFVYVKSSALKFFIAVPLLKLIATHKSPNILLFLS